MVASEQDIWKLLNNVPDPEIPVISVVELGVVRKVIVAHANDSSHIQIVVTPTYSGCPAIDMMSAQIRFALLKEGYKNIEIVQQLSPAWTTDWMTDATKQKLKEYGIAPPKEHHLNDDLFAIDSSIECPRCNSLDTKQISQFGSTACKSLYQCNNCLEPFEYFKCHK